MTLHHTVVGVDGSLVSVRASDWAAAEAVRHGTALRVVYAVADRDEAAPVLASAASRVRQRYPDLAVETVAAECGAVAALVRESADAELTVVGTRGLGALTGAAFGSVSLRLAALAQGPLLVVRGDHPCDHGQDVLRGTRGRRGRGELLVLGSRGGPSGGGQSSGGRTERHRGGPVPLLS